MEEKIHVNFDGVEKTLFLPLWGRAMETKRKKPLLVDQAALDIIEKVDLDVSTMAAKMEELSRIAWIMRSVICDDVIRAFLAKYPAATVVNIGCGLDTAFERLDNGSLLWYDLDLPEVIELRKKFIHENERREFIATSFLERDWLKRIQVKQNVLFMAAGVFYYFTEEEVRDFLVRLAHLFPGCQMIFDACSQTGVRTANRMVLERSGIDEKSYLVWALDDTRQLLAWDERFRLLKTYTYFRKRGMPMSLKSWMFSWLSDALKIQYLVHLEVSR